MPEAVDLLRFSLGFERGLRRITSSCATSSTVITDDTLLHSEPGLSTMVGSSSDFKRFTGTFFKNASSLAMQASW